MTSPLTRVVEAVVFAAEEPVSPSDIARHVAAPVADVRDALRDLSADWGGHGIELVERGGRWLFQTAPDLGYLLQPTRAVPRKLSRAAVETLAIVAYHEPVTRAEIEDIRGVQVSPGTLDVLLATGWIKAAGRRESPGRPLQFATTPAFLVDFGLSDRRDLPGIAELRATGLLDPAPPTGETPAQRVHSEG
ncbi:MAG: SMC-Scp complex subunit ScpB [Sphingomonadaceae bacterium]|nr:SMC-Scp complex subunit ScpB [Sphingomonadaceae bacterium]